MGETVVEKDENMEWKTTWTNVRKISIMKKWVQTMMA
jgi:hypothetical protein